MALPTWWTWVWVGSGSWWWTGRPGVLQCMGSQSRTRLSDWTELNWWRNLVKSGGKRKSVFLEWGCMCSIIHFLVDQWSVKPCSRFRVGSWVSCELMPRGGNVYTTTVSVSDLWHKLVIRSLFLMKRHFSFPVNFSDVYLTV